MDPIEPRDLPRPRDLGQAFFRATNPHISHADFEAKWKKAQKSPLRLLRSFPQAYWLLLERVPEAHVPGRRGICYGDAHLENFGFLRSVKGPMVFVANDLDDAGPGEVGLDALRWAVSLALSGMRARQLAPLLRHYAAAACDARAAGTPLPAELVPDVDEVIQKRLAKLVRVTAGKGPALVRGEETGLSAVDASERALVTEAFEREADLSGLKLCDVAELDRDSGGSGGLRRFWALTRGGPASPRSKSRASEGTLDVLELKELTTPAVQWGHHRTPLGDRIAEVKAVLHAGTPVREHFAVRLGHAEFLVRSRLARASLDLTELDSEQRTAAFLAQASLLGRHHRAAYRDIEPAALADWLATSARTVSEHFEALFEEFA